MGGKSRLSSLLHEFIPATDTWLVAEAIKESGALSRKEMGKVIGALKKRPEAALIDFSAASKLIQSKLP